MTRYGLWGQTSRDFLTYEGRVLVHDNRAEMEWLFPGATVREVPPSFRPDQCIPIGQHPQLVAVQFPLNRKDFRRA